MNNNSKDTRLDLIKAVSECVRTLHQATGQPIKQEWGDILLEIVRDEQIPNIARKMGKKCTRALMRALDI